ncbi:hypothetical protein Micbo1qcDRAFT_8643 [Microdochium bolleyi]|uniref:Secreted protein n=1 Tax=Microdochium bolleyi TaxID=196109 RepID=A0A136JK78_9PEZI|nr:hypothetical protein Micbo1qcDRAFT_8643 [Microdochium bolleyi]
MYKGYFLMILLAEALSFFNLCSKRERERGGVSLRVCVAKPSSIWRSAITNIRTKEMQRQAVCAVRCLCARGRRGSLSEPEWSKKTKPSQSARRPDIEGGYVLQKAKSFLTSRAL